MIQSVAAVIYNVLLTFVFSVSTACAFFLLRRKKHTAFAAIMAIFISYMIDNMIVFCTEIIPAFADIYDRMFLQTPSIKTVCFIIRITSLLYLLNQVMPAFHLKAVVIFTAVHAFTLICAPMITKANWMVFFYYFTSQFIIILVCSWALLRLRHAQGSADKKLKQGLLYFLVMTLIVLIEDTFVIFFVDVYTPTGLNIFNRNFSENVLFLGFALLIIRYTLRCIDELTSAVSADDILENAVVSPQSDPVAEFAGSYNLTERELEILRCMLDGKSQQEISDILLIALGTVKTHMHNIYFKAGATNRNGVIAMYQQFLENEEV